MKKPTKDTLSVVIYLSMTCFLCSCHKSNNGDVPFVYFYGQGGGVLCEIYPESGGKRVHRVSWYTKRDPASTSSMTINTPIASGEYVRGARYNGTFIVIEMPDKQKVSLYMMNYKDGKLISRSSMPSSKDMADAIIENMNNKAYKYQQSWIKFDIEAGK